jgi:hypothetical protein
MNSDSHERRNSSRPPSGCHRFSPVVAIRKTPMVVDAALLGNLVLFAYRTFST